MRCCYNENITDRVKCFKKTTQGEDGDRCSKTRRGRSGKETKTSQLSRNSFLDQLSITKMCSNMFDIIISVLLLEY